MKPLDGKAVLVTGAADGIGRETALAFAAKGGRVALADIDEEAVKQVSEQIDGSIFFKSDVTREEDVDSAVRGTIEGLGALDVFVMNAGVSVSGPPESIPLEDWRWVADVNMWAHVYGVRAALPHFRERGSGHLVHVSSAAGILGTPALAPYCMTKFAVFGLAESLAVTLHGSGIGVSVVCPLWVATGIAGRSRITPDPALGLEQEDLRTLGTEFLELSGVAPQNVAAAIVEAVEEEQFLVLSHPEVLKFAQIKWSDPESYIGKAAKALAPQRRYFGERS